MPICHYCEQDKPEEDFKRKVGDGYSNYCIACRNSPVNIYGKKYARKNRSQMKAYNKEYNFGVTQAQYDALLAQQEGKCAICGVHHNDKEKLPAIDHCHKTGVIRGLLCNNCNTALGKFNDSPSLLERAALYLRTSRTGLVHKKFRQGV